MSEGVVMLLIFPTLLSTSAFAADPSCEDGFIAPKFTPQLNYSWSPTTFDVTPGVEQFLANAEDQIDVLRQNGASIRDQLKLLVEVVEAAVRYDEQCSIKPLRTFDDVLIERRGACLQINLLAAALLSRSGFSARIVLREPPGGLGHLWLEVGRGDRAFIVDPANYGYVATVAEIRSSQPSDSSFSAEWYLHPERKYRAVQ